MRLSGSSLRMLWSTLDLHVVAAEQWDLHVVTAEQWVIAAGMPSFDSSQLVVSVHFRGELCSFDLHARRLT